MTHGPEYKVKLKVKLKLTTHGAWYFMPAMGTYGKSGVPDIVGIHKGRGFTVECKAGKNKPTALQELCMRHIREAGGVALVLNETDGWDALEAFLNEQH